MKFFLICLVLISLFFNTYGIQWGINIDKKNWLDIHQLKTIENILTSSWKEIYSYDKYVRKPLGSSLFYKDKNIKVKINQEYFNYPRHVYDWVRSYALRSFHVDEILTLKALASMNPRQLDFDPKFYLYGGCYIYGIGFSLFIAKLFGFIKLQKNINFYFYHLKELRKIYIVVRIIGAVFAALSVIFIYFAACNFFAKRVAIFSTLFFVSCPMIAVFSHYMQPHPYVLFWIGLSLYFFSLVYKNPNKRKFYIFSGLATGASIGCLVMSGAYLIIFCILHFLKKGSLRNFFIYIISCLSSFFLTNPYVLIKPYVLLHDLKIATTGYTFQPILSHLGTYFYYTAPTGFTTPVWIFSLISIFYSLFRFKRNIPQISFTIFLLFSVFYNALISWTVIHYNMWYSPILFLTCSIFADKLVSRKKIFLIPVIIILLWSFLYTAAHIRIFALKDARIKATEWIRNNIPEKSIIGISFARNTTPFINPFIYKVIPYKDRKTKYQYLIFSSLTHYDESKGILRFDRIEELPLFLDIPLDKFKVVKIFYNQPKFLFLKIKLKKIIPWDWNILNPWVFILTRL